MVLVSLAGCRYAHGDFTVDVTRVEGLGTVASVHWATEEPGNAWIEYGTTRDLGSSTPLGTEAETDHTVLLAGMPASSTVFWRAFSEVNGETLTSTQQELETGPPPHGTPDVDVHDGADTSLAEAGFTLTTSLNDALVLMYDPEGRLVWWHECGEDTVVAQARMSFDGRAVIYNTANIDFGTDTSEIVRIALDGEEMLRLRTPLGHHDFVELPDGGYAWLAIDVREWEDEEGVPWDVVGDVVVEADAAGVTRTVWSTWDAADAGMMPVTVDTTDDNDIYPQGLDWTHANSLVYDATDDSYVVSVHNLSALVHVQRVTGEVDWQLGGDASDFRLASGRPFTRQHSPEFTPTSLLVFDNGEVEGQDTYSEAIEYSVDFEARTYAEVWHYDAEQRHSTFLLGDADRLDNGNTLVSFGNAGVLAEVSADDELAFELRLAAGHVFGFSHHVTSLGGRW